MPTVSFGTFAKRRNSTKQPASLPDQRTVKLKESTSYDAPTFIITGDVFNYNYAQWGNRYYFITDVRSLHNNLSEIDCVLDVLATYKSDILASTQFVCYSSHRSSIWLPDTRLPSLSLSHVSENHAAISVFSPIGSYVLSVNGKNGCELYHVSLNDISDLLDNITQWRSDAEDEFVDGLTSPGGDIVVATENLYTVLARAGAFGNAYSEAPSCIRSCIWIPFNSSVFDVTSAGKRIYLGQFDTGVDADAISSQPYTDFVTIPIPWHYSDWRRSTNEQLYLYLPLVGNVAISADNLTHASQITIAYSITPTDGCIAYEVVAGSEVIGTYGATCCANYPIGISQQASAGDIINSLISGGEKMISMGVNSSVSPLSSASAAAGAGFEVMATAYNVTNKMYSNNNSSIGGIGGGVGSGLDLAPSLQDVYRETVTSPDAIASTMGYPTMQSMSLASLTGFCQCANAHVEAAAMSRELDIIDAYLNSGFYIE